MTLLLSRREVAALLTMPECIAAVEKMFRDLGNGKLPVPGILGIKSWIALARSFSGSLPHCCAIPRSRF